ncbi:hypothetical protein BDN72DRAFT_573139 [Pluteus cervinus]|uniref:Uncharacterized protein n=1 Tax=Pluteus cervinus TaxID=181527 RepID=A0ACD3AW80_9AGAR|nr:hypothetical protein BDN72DRAFT_573139 [Pluteus cervinus]
MYPSCRRFCFKPHVAMMFRSSAIRLFFFSRLVSAVVQTFIDIVIIYGCIARRPKGTKNTFLVDTFSVWSTTTQRVSDFRRLTLT